MMKQYLFLLLLSFFLVDITMAQERVIRGKVISGKDSSSVGGATIAVAGSAATTNADRDGRFVITLPANKTVLKISAIGFIGTEIRVSNTDISLTIVLEEKISELKEVVVTALGIQRQK